ncbi:LacI family DNA-binding transcriptional regulator [Aquipuribacter nitratireducens]|uniref:LacI family DNA-binding transcriptional regulator n=1 Tax=Aquipuribacter nitratireducens TaxID=650104 RepID=A0ABW0GTM9_9MICO
MATGTDRSDLSVRTPVSRRARGRATMRDVAQLAGVGIKTVSRVVNRESGVSPAMAARVEAAVQALGYRPDAGASALRRADGRSSAIGVVVDDVANGFAGALLRAVEKVASEQGTVVLAGSADEDGAREAEVARAFVDRRVDGLVVAPSGRAMAQLEEELRTGLPVVVVDRATPGLPVDQVVSTNEVGAAVAVRHLLEHGHRRVAYLGDLGRISTARERVAGYHRALTEAGVEPDAALVVEDLHTRAAAEAATLRLLAGDLPPERRPTALFCAQHRVTAGALSALHHLGRQREVAMVGFDDFLFADLLEPGVTVVAQDPGSMGHQAATALFARIDGLQEPPRTLWVPTTLLRRGSGEIPPGR